MGANMARRSSSTGSTRTKMASLIAVRSVSTRLLRTMLTEPLSSRSRIPPLSSLCTTHRQCLQSVVLKLAISLTLALYEITTSPQASQTTTIMGIFEELGSAVFSGDSWKMAIPAMLYTMQNSLQYIAAGNLDAATFQVTSQLKILTTAVFSVILLGRVLDTRKWLSLVLLMAGVAVASYPVGFGGETVLTIKDLKDTLAPHPPRNIWDLKALGNAAAGQLVKRSATYEGIDEDFANQNPRVQASVGLLALTMACVLSGLAGVYFEKILKEPKSNFHTTSVWIRNVQLSFYSLWPALFVGVLFKDGEHIARDGFFAGYNSVVWTAVVMQALGGITVALVIKYADNIAKNFATSFSIILSFLASVSLFDLEITTLVSRVVEARYVSLLTQHSIC
jgi:UDP-galactose transporter